MPCEMCGQEAPLKTAEIEGNRMKVCSDCAKFGKVISPPSAKDGGGAAASGGSGGGAPSAPTPPPRSKPKPRRDVYDKGGKVLAEDYGARVRKARQKLDLTPEELADEINEKKSVISHTETQDHRPSDALVKKLERKLDITLMETPEHTELASKSQKSSSAGPVTLGDLIKEQMDDE